MICKDIIHLVDGWDIFCIGRDNKNHYWLEARHIESGKLMRDFDLSIVHAPYIRDVVQKTNELLKEYEENKEA